MAIVPPSEGVNDLGVRSDIKFRFVQGYEQCKELRLLGSDAPYLLHSPFDKLQ